MEESNLFDDEMDKYNKQAYRGRFGILYRTISTKLISKRSFELKPNNNYKIKVKKKKDPSKLLKIKGHPSPKSKRVHLHVLIKI